MKYVYTLLFAVSAFFAGAQCVPSQDDTTSLLYPVPDTTGGAVLYLGQYYGDTITINVPSDTAIDNPIGPGTIDVSVDSLVLTSVTGLPPGMTYGCHNNDCFALGGQQGCLHYYGTPQVADTFMVTVSGAVYTSLLPTTFDETFPLIVVDASSVPETKNKELIRVYPNPAKDEVTLELDAQSDAGSVRLFSVLGSEVYSGTLMPGVNRIATKDFPAGYYVMSIEINGEHYSKQLAVIR